MNDLGTNTTGSGASNSAAVDASERNCSQTSSSCFHDFIIARMHGNSHMHARSYARSLVQPFLHDSEDAVVSIIKESGGEAGKSLSRLGYSKFQLQSYLGFDA